MLIHSRLAKRTMNDDYLQLLLFPFIFYRVPWVDQVQKTLPALQNVDVNVGTDVCK